MPFNKYRKMFCRAVFCVRIYLRIGPLGHIDATYVKRLFEIRTDKGPICYAFYGEKLEAAIVSKGQSLGRASGSLVLQSDIDVLARGPELSSYMTLSDGTDTVKKRSPRKRKNARKRERSASPVKILLENRALITTVPVDVDNHASKRLRARPCATKADGQLPNTQNQTAEEDMAVNWGYPSAETNVSNGTLSCILYAKTKGASSDCATANCSQRTFTSTDAAIAYSRETHQFCPVCIDALPKPPVMSELVKCFFGNTKDHRAHVLRRHANFVVCPDELCRKALGMKNCFTRKQHVVQHTGADASPAEIKEMMEQLKAAWKQALAILRTTKPQMYAVWHAIDTCNDRTQLEILTFRAVELRQANESVSDLKDSRDTQKRKNDSPGGLCSGAAESIAVATGSEPVPLENREAHELGGPQLSPVEQTANECVLEDSDILNFNLHHQLHLAEGPAANNDANSYPEFGLFTSFDDASQYSHDADLHQLFDIHNGPNLGVPFQNFTDGVSSPFVDSALEASLSQVQPQGHCAASYASQPLQTPVHQSSTFGNFGIPGFIPDHYSETSFQPTG